MAHAPLVTAEVRQTPAPPNAGAAKGGSRAPLPAPLKLKTCTLPTGLVVSCPTTRDEVMTVYQENFVDRQYCQHGVDLAAGDTVLDVGANSGMFALCAAEAVGAAGRVLALEPAPLAAAACADNAARHAAWLAARGGGAAAAARVETIQAAVGDGSAAQLTLVVYDAVSTLSTLAPDHAAAETALQSFVETQIRNGTPVGSRVQRALIRAGSAFARFPPTAPLVRAAARAAVRRVLASRREVEVAVVTVSGLLRERGVQSVGLLKIDVERAELDVLRGVSAEDWPRIEQVAAEVHEALLAPVVDLLKGPAGFGRVVAVPVDAALIGPGMHMVYATRRGGAA
ncbi:hypothetical protein Rsub_08741 [Raphidocelis subcapitata]|uniref:Methyltransferase FkbM domain-containing protein n=1 Tax=Raphidocelis subcapitata TaxID=307507 RepID=A0A2V0P8M1_9CHLO|nr:hypothetical protein Rsub_08741 [Raphidocelis subcapitata]|eukprot:GBF96196.1 hypothetical protein Rsub_08741 [Raphidocelis subcapitata]